MRHAYLILVHRNFDQARRLIERLLLGDAGVIVHVDRKVEIPRDFLAGLQVHGSRVVAAQQRHNTEWGSYEAVLAGLSLLKEGVERFPQARYLSLLSGQDYPIKSPEYIDEFFSQSESNYVPFRPLVEERWKYGGLRRVNRYYWAKNRKSIAGFCFRTIPLPPRRFPIPSEKLFVGSQWWSIRRPTALRILDFVRDTPEVLKAFRWTYIPDEMFFATVLVGFMREPDVVNSNLRFIDYFILRRDYLRLKILNRQGIRNLGANDLASLRSSGALFARKFDLMTDPGILDLLDHSEIGLDISNG